MNTLNRFEIAGLLDNLKDAEDDMAKMLEPEFRGVREIYFNQAKMSLKFAREKLLRASLMDIALEPAPALALAAE